MWPPPREGPTNVEPESNKRAASNPCILAVEVVQTLGKGHTYRLGDFQRLSLAVDVIKQSFVGFFRNHPQGKPFLDPRLRNYGNPIELGPFSVFLCFFSHTIPNVFFLSPANVIKWSFLLPTKKKKWSFLLASFRSSRQGKLFFFALLSENYGTQTSESIFCFHFSFLSPYRTYPGTCWRHPPPPLVSFCFISIMSYYSCLRKKYSQ